MIRVLKELKSSNLKSGMGCIIGATKKKSLIYKGFREAEPDPEIAIFYRWQLI